jgi:hypothetical protein
MLHHCAFLRILTILTALLVALIFLIHCAGPQVALEKEEAKLRNRIDEYWQYRIKGDVERAYQFEVPSFREKYSVLYYVNRFRMVKYLEADIQEVKIEGKEAGSAVKLTYLMLVKGLTKKKLTKLEQEKWVNIKSTWYHVPEDFDMKKTDSNG